MNGETGFVIMIVLYIERRRRLKAEIVCSRLKVFTLRRVCMRSTGGIARAIEDVAS